MNHLPGPNKILVFLPNWVGDVVMATPALRAMRLHFDQAKIIYIGRRVALDTLAGTTWADGTICESSNTSGVLDLARMAMQVRRERFDLAVLLPNSFRAALLARIGNATRRAGYDRDARGWLLTDKLEPVRQGSRFAPVPTIEYYNTLVKMLGVPEPTWQMELPVAPADDQAAADIFADAQRHAHQPQTGPIVMLNPGASFGPSKLWAPKKYAALADELARLRNAQIIINAAPSEKQIAQAVADAMTHPPLINFAHRDNSLGLLKGLLRRCDLLVTNDTGARHFAAAMGTAVVTIFGSTDPTWARLDYPKERTVRAGAPCSPCQRKVCSQPPGPAFHQCMEKVSVEEVLAPSLELLDGGRA